MVKNKKGIKMKNKNFGFTLAEVLITLAIIGVVAAMTMPTLVNKYQDRVNETRYKKAVSMLSQAVQLSMAEIDSPGNMTNTDLWNCKDRDDVQACYKNATKKLFKSIALDGEALIDKMADVDYGETTNPWDDVDYAFTTGDGITFGYASGDEGLRLILDTNVASKPNNLSKDLYALQVGANGKVTDITASLADGSNTPGSECRNFLANTSNLVDQGDICGATWDWVNCVAGVIGYGASCGYAEFSNYGNPSQTEKDICAAAGGIVGDYNCMHP